MHVMLIVKANEASDVGLRENSAKLVDLLQFHDAMVRAGVVLSVEALQPVCRGVRVGYSADRRTSVADPVLETPHILGFWLIRVHSMMEAIEWAQRAPLVGGEIEVRQTAFQLFPLH